MEERKDRIRKVDKTGRVHYQRLDRRRFFYPNEWKLFLKQIIPRLRPHFKFIFNTGCRLDESLYVRPYDFDWKRGNVRLWKTKTIARKGESHGKPRTIKLSTKFAREMRKHCKDFESEDYIFHGSIQSVNQVIKRATQRAKIDDWYNFSSHNIRKTHGMYLKALGIDIAEICTRLGHDYNTYIKHYGSADVFSEKDMRGIRELFDDLYIRQRRY